jgi:arginine exporter protein ArgO
VDFYHIITIVTCITSTATLILVAVAVLPHIKQGAAVLRDAILWGTFVLVVAIAGWSGWQRLTERADSPAPPLRGQREVAGSRAAVAIGTSSPPSADPYYQRPSTD